MRREDCKVGMRVVCTKAFASRRELVGKIGTIIAVNIDIDEVGVEFDDPFSEGHSCNGRCKYYHGRYGGSESLEEYIESPKEFCLSMTFSDLMEG